MRYYNIQHYTGPIPKIFNATYTDKCGKHVRTWKELRDSLLGLINAALCADTSVSISKNTREREKLPMLIGKTVNHTFADGMTYRGRVISQVPGFCSWFNIKYDNDDSIYSYQLIDDYRNGELEIVPSEL